MRARLFYAALLALVAAACAASRPRPEVRQAPAKNAAFRGSSNALREDYAGSDACKGCHASEYDAWARSPMHRMTRDGSAADARAPFDGKSLRFRDDVVTLTTRGGVRFVEIRRARGGEERYRVTRVIGGRTREDFAGVLVSTPSERAPGEGSTRELVLPVSYLIASGELRYKGYSVLVHDRPGASAGPVWSETCIFCHNTAPFVSTVLGALGDERLPAYQGAVLDRWLPAERRWQWIVKDRDGLEDAVRRLVKGRWGAAAGESLESGRGFLRSAIQVTRDRFGAADLVEVGIGCEACHNGARAHAVDPANRAEYLPRAPFLEAKSASPIGRAQAINRVCARCHQVLFSRYPWTWEGGRRQSVNPGGSSINSGEARDFLLGGCASELACTGCHDPHDASARRDEVKALESPNGNRVCTKCHAQYADDAALAAHSHHRPGGAGSACIACHMPDKNMGLDLRLTRYHRIGSPTAPERVLLDRPLECALCHPKESVESLAATMEKWWRKAYPRAELARLYGSTDANVMVATLERGKAHEQAVAAVVLGDLHDPAFAPGIARLVVNEYPLVRSLAARALGESLRAPCVIDMNDASTAKGQAHACLARAGLADPPWPALPVTPQSSPEPAED